MKKLLTFLFTLFTITLFCQIKPSQIRKGDSTIAQVLVSDTLKGGTLAYKPLGQEIYRYMSPYIEDYWSKSGNTINSSDRLGTLNNYSLPFITNNLERMRITNTGNVVIGSTSSNTSAALEIVSTTKGVLLPKMTTAQINAISNPAIGLLVYDISIPCLKIKAPASWEVLGTAYLNTVIKTGTSNYNVNTNTKNVFCNNGSTNITITLPLAISCVGFEVTISRDHLSTGTVTIEPSGSNLVQDINRFMSSQTNLKGIGSYGQSQTFISNGSHWLNKS